MVSSLKCEQARKLIVLAEESKNLIMDEMSLSFENAQATRIFLSGSLCLISQMTACRPLMLWQTSI